MQPTGLIYAGKVIPLDGSVPVYNWMDHGLQFKPAIGGRKRVRPINLKVWHWTGGEGTYQGLFNVLKQRELGIETYIGNDAIYQFCDPAEVDTFDAGSYNPRSWGTEIRNYGYTDWDRPLPAGYKERETYETRMNGRPRRFARFHPDQIKMAIALAVGLSRAIPTLPMTIPVGRDGKLFPDVLPNAFMANFRGHVGHYHLTTNKSDPGHDLMQAMLDTGKFAKAEVPA